MSKRQDIDDYFLDLVKLIGSRGTCDRGKSGCVIVRDKHILSTGYVGSPVGVEHCDDIGHELETRFHEDGSKTGHCIRTTHAEQNAIVNAARHGSSIEGATLYCTMVPCYTCIKLIINAGIKRVVADYDYHASQRTKDLINHLMLVHAIKLEMRHEKTMKYDNGDTLDVMNAKQTETSTTI